MLDEVFGLVEESRVKNGRAFEWACQRGHLELARWLVERFALTAEDARRDDVFVKACRKGHLKLAGWLADTFGFDVRDENYHALRWACMVGRHKVAAWLLARSALTPDVVHVEPVQGRGYRYTLGVQETERWLAPQRSRKGASEPEAEPELSPIYPRVSGIVALPQAAGAGWSPGIAAPSFAGWSVVITFGIPGGVRICQQIQTAQSGPRTAG
ncbi:MAG TPA: ankyrin repeat domain-containing protein [Elusimicrobiota bacterium]|jgi:hypothetical protein|nr:ankyrin repeat domain-containing protein [Elusimicrobiota bacterium]